MRKKILSILSIILILSSTSVVTQAKESDQVVFVENVLTSFFENKDLGETNDLSEYVTQELSSFLNDKIENHQYSSKINETNKTNYKVNIHLLEEKKLVDKTYLKFNVEKSFNYIDLPNVDSGEGVIVEVLMESKKNKIIDIYEQGNYYDSFTRGENIDIKKENQNKEDFLNSKEIKDKQKEIKSNIDKTYEREMKETLKNSEKNLVDTNIGIRSALINSNIVNYARNNYNKTSPASGNGVVTYYDFSQISGNWDCTNFVSHSLLAGGATVYDTGNSGISSTGWYYRSLSNRSSSWSGVTQLHSFLTTNGTKGPYGVSNPYATWGNFTTGNILQFHNGSIWRHSTIITGTYTMDGRVGALVTGRTSPGVYNNNQKAADIYAPNAKRVINVVGNY